MKVNENLLSEIYLHLSFIEHMYYYEYYNVLNMLAETGGVTFLIFLLIIVPILLILWLIRYAITMSKIRDENAMLAKKYQQDSLMQQLGKYQEMFNRSML
jgi:hypothetical protein